jgi:hypothetical protein
MTVFNIKLNENLSSGREVDTCRQPDWWIDVTKLIGTFCDTQTFLKWIKAVQNGVLACFCEHAIKCVIWDWNLLCFWMWPSVVVAARHCSGVVCITFYQYILACLNLCDLTCRNTIISIAMKTTSKSMQYLVVSWIAVYCYRKTIYTIYTTYIFMCHIEFDVTVYLQNLHQDFLCGCGRFMFIQIKLEFMFQCRQCVGALRAFWSWEWVLRLMGQQVILAVRHLKQTVPCQMKKFVRMLSQVCITPRLICDRIHLIWCLITRKSY